MNYRIVEITKNVEDSGDFIELLENSNEQEQRVIVEILDLPNAIEIWNTLYRNNGVIRHNSINGVLKTSIEGYRLDELFEGSWNVLEYSNPRV